MYHVGAKQYIQKDKYREVACETDRKEHIRRLTEEVGASMNLDVSKFCASGKSVTRPNKFPPVLVTIITSKII